MLRHGWGGSSFFNVCLSCPRFMACVPDTLIPNLVVSPDMLILGYHAGTGLVACCFCILS